MKWHRQTYYIDTHRHTCIDKEVNIQTKRHIDEELHRQTKRHFHRQARKHTIDGQRN